MSHRHWRKVIGAALVASLALVLAFTVGRVQAAGTTRYANFSDPTCGGQSPCYYSQFSAIKNAVNASGNGDTIIVQNNGTEGDLTFSNSTSLTLEGANANVTISGGTAFPSLSNWTIQNLIFTGSLWAQSTSGGLTISNVHAVQIVIGAQGAQGSGVISGTIDIDHCVTTGSGGGQIAIIGGKGLTVNGNFTISHNMTGVINVLAYTGSTESDLAASMTIDSNTTQLGANIGVTFNPASPQSGTGNVSGSITISNNTTQVTPTASQDVGFGVTLQGSSPYTVLGSISGAVTFTGNTTYKLAVITTSNNSVGNGNFSGSITATGNTAERLEFGSNNAIQNTNVTVKNNDVLYRGSPAPNNYPFITVSAQYGINGGTGIDIESNTGNSEVTVITNHYSIDAPVTILNNKADHVLYQPASTNTGAFTISGNVLASGSQTGQDGNLVLQNASGSFQSGTLQGNNLPALVGNIIGPITGTFNVTGNAIGTTNFAVSGGLTGNGSLSFTDNYLSGKTAVNVNNAAFHFNTILGNFGGATFSATDNWWGCNAGINNCGLGNGGGGTVEPHLLASLTLSCPAGNTINAKVDLLTDSNNAQPSGDLAPASATINSSAGTVVTSPVVFNGSGSTNITGVNSATVTATINNQQLSKSTTCGPTPTPTDTPTPTITPTPGPIASDTIGVYRNGTFLLRNQNTTGFADEAFAFNNGSQPYPVAGNWTSGGTDTVGLYDRSNGQYFLRNSNTAGTPDEQFVLGNPQDEPIAGQWNVSNGHDGVGVFRPSNGLLLFRNSLSTGFADYVMILGVPGDQGLAGDWSGQHYDSPGVYRPSNQLFLLSNTICGNCSVFADYTVQLGNPGDNPITGDWIAQGHAGAGVFRPSSGLILLKNQLQTGYADIVIVYGVPNDVPLDGHWIVNQPPIGQHGPSVLVPSTSVPTPYRTPAPGSNSLGG